MGAHNPFLPPRPSRAARWTMAIIEAVALSTFVYGILAMLVACNQEAGDALQVAAGSSRSAMVQAATYLEAAE